MSAVTSIAILLVALASGGVVWKLTGQRSRRRVDGVEQFHRHLGALSPEARRSIVQKARRN